MEFTLDEFAGEELRNYEITRKITGNIDNPKTTDQKFNAAMLICKKTLRAYNPNLQDGGRIISALSGKTLKVVGLKLDDVIEVEGYKYKVTEILPRIYADFVEFSLELMRNGQ